MYQNDWDDNVFPLAYLLTFRTYGTWLHGDERGSVDAHGRNIYGTPRIEPNTALEKRMLENLAQKPFVFDAIRREAVTNVFKEICLFKDYDLLAVNVRSNHAHLVICAQSKPEPLINLLKRKATRRLRELKLIARDESPWSRGGSRRYLWKQRHVDLAIDYVLYCQEDRPFEIED
jgi:REP element-mobilizing transposase RayT